MLSGGGLIAARCLCMRSPNAHPAERRRDARRCSTAQDYVADRRLATAVFLALKLARPLFLEGEAGVGKTEIAKVLAAGLGAPLVRLQCYEGLDTAAAVYEWNYPRQMIEIRLAEAAGGVERERARARHLHARASC